VALGERGGYISTSSNPKPLLGQIQIAPGFISRDTSIRLSSTSPGSSHTRSCHGLAQRITSSSDVNVSIIQCGRFAAIEVKKKGNEPTPEQLEFLDAVHRANGIGTVAYSTDDVMTLL
jgi:hypothetical protein